MRKQVARASDRWDTCLHEAAHALAVLHYGLPLGDTVLTHGGETGFTQWNDASLNPRVEKDALIGAVIALVGPEQSKRGPLWFPYGLESDLSSARYRLRYFPELRDFARGEARDLVVANQREIRRIARRLWTDDRIPAGVIKNSS